MFVRMFDEISSVKFGISPPLQLGGYFLCPACCMLLATLEPLRSLILTEGVTCNAAAAAPHDRFVTPAAETMPRRYGSAPTVILASSKLDRESG